MIQWGRKRKREGREKKKYFGCRFEFRLLGVGDSKVLGGSAAADAVKEQTERSRGRGVGSAPFAWSG